MNPEIVFSDGTALPALGVWAGPKQARGERRETLTVKLAATHAEAVSRFVDGAAFSVRQEETEVLPVLDGAGEPVLDALGNSTYENKTMVKSYDKSAYCLAGDITDHRDGTITVMAHCKTEGELMVEALEAENAALLFENLTGEDYGNV